MARKAKTTKRKITKGRVIRKPNYLKPEVKKSCILYSISGEKVRVGKATLRDIRNAEKNRKKYNALEKELVKVPSAKVRQELYEETARAIQDLESSQLPTFGGRPWKVTCSISDQGTCNSSPYFRWYRGKLELACLPHLIEKIPEPPKFPGYKRTSSDDEEEDESRIDDFDPEELQRIQELQERPISTLSTISWEYRNILPAHGGAPTPNICIKWLSPVHTYCYSRKVAWEHAMKLAENEMFIDKIIHGLGSTGKNLRTSYSSRPQALKAGNMRFLRDGLWVVGQENSWQLERTQQLQKSSLKQVAECCSQNDEISTPKRRSMSGQACYLQQNRDIQLKKMKNEKILLQQNPSGKQQPLKGITLRQAETVLRTKWKKLSPEHQATWIEKARKNGESLKQREDGNSITPLDQHDRDATKSSPGINSPLSTVKSAVTSDEINEHRITLSASLPDPSSNTLVTQILYTEISSVGDIRMHDSTTKENIKNCLSMAADSTIQTEEVAKVIKCDEKYLRKSNPEIMQSSTVAAATKFLTGKKRKNVITKQMEDRKLTLFNRNAARWCLTPAQIQLCHDACEDHFENVMRTVNARDLTGELENGFDVLRERGRGRYDMELPIFNTAQFAFLNCTMKAPWMPIVREILGDDVALIHKGAFVSLPGASIQIYHQDGPHLHKSTQKPCHAINVFIPLVDLCNRNGPTEFCLGTHILDQDDYDRDYIEIPKVKAGVPVIFDYRLGHRGLANTSSLPRPVVYCTYATAAGDDGKEFRDSANFSRRRYKKIGELIKKPASREERLSKRNCS